jgi:concentrative nucleoside transporter, CNT family
MNLLFLKRADPMEQAVGVLGIFVMLGIAWLFSDNKKQMDWRVIGAGLGIQFLLAILILKTDAGHAAFDYAKNAVNAVIALSDEGAKVVFGDGFMEHFFAFKVLPTIIFVSSLSYLLFYFGVLQKVVEGLAWIMHKTMGVSGTESLAAAANVFVGQTEAPLMIKPYLATMTKSEIMCMMTGGMATVAGGVLAAYVGFGISAGHLLAASIMSAPAAIVIAKIMCPETEESPTRGAVKLTLKPQEANAFEAACKGATEGLYLCLNVGAMLIAFIALVALINYILAGIGGLFGFSVTMQEILSVLFTPLAWVMGIPWEDCGKIGLLLGEKMALNEFLAYIHLGDLVKAEAITERSEIIATYALCGFANFSSIAIQIGGMGGLCPERKTDFAKAGFRSMIGGTLAAFITACIAGLLI